MYINKIENKELGLPKINLKGSAKKEKEHAKALEDKGVKVEVEQCDLNCEGCGS